MLLVRICHLVALPNLQQVISGSAGFENAVDVKQNVVSDNDVVNEILRSFEGAKVV